MQNRVVIPSTVDYQLYGITPTHLTDRRISRDRSPDFPGFFVRFTYHPPTVDSGNPGLISRDSGCIRHSMLGGLFDYRQTSSLNNGDFRAYGYRPGDMPGLACFLPAFL